MTVIFFNDKRSNFLPLVFTQPLAKLRIGILSIEEKWEHHFLNKKFEFSFAYLTEDYLATKFPNNADKVNIYINSRFLPNERLVDFIIENLNVDEALFQNGNLIVAKCTPQQFDGKSYYIKDTNESLISIELKTITDFFSKNGETIKADFDLITTGRESKSISKTNTLIGDKIFIEEGAKVEASVLNSIEGPIYIGKNAEVMEGSLIRGGMVLCEGAVLKMGAKIYGPTTIGRYSKVGGEVSNSVIQDYSNKGHDGFIGNSVIGSWCNLGADTNTSNLKNNYGEVSLWDYKSKELKPSGLQFCGLVMGDHSKCSINTMFNTGTTVGVSANIFDGGFPPKHIPSFSWGGSKGFTEYKLDKMFEVAQEVMKRRDVELDEEDKQILSHVFKITTDLRN